MRVALLSDVHANLPALTAVLRHLGRLEGPAVCSCGGRPEADDLWCLGDTVGYNAQPAECLSLIRKHAGIVLLGNHDWAVVSGDVRIFNSHAAAAVRHSRSALSSEDIDYLRSLESSRRVVLANPASIPPGPDADLLLVHGSPDDPLWEYLDRASAQRFLRRDDLPPVVAFGHTHVPFVLGGPGGEVGRRPSWRASAQGEPSHSRKGEQERSAGAGGERGGSAEPGAGGSSARGGEQGAAGRTGEEGHERAAEGASSRQADPFRGAIAAAGPRGPLADELRGGTGTLAGPPVPRLLLNAGSVGQPRDGDPRAAFLLLDTDSLRVELHRVEYDVRAASDAVRAAGLPAILADRLFLGR